MRVDKWKTQGVYEIRNIINDKLYIGHTTNMGYRWQSHLHSLGIGKHSSRKLQKDFDKYGYKAFTFRIIELVDKSIAKKDLRNLEQKYIDEKNTIANGYNMVASVATRESIKATLDCVYRVSKYKDINKVLDNIVTLKPRNSEDKLFAYGKTDLSNTWYSKSTTEEIIALLNNLENAKRNICNVDRRSIYINIDNCINKLGSSDGVKIRESKAFKRVNGMLYHRKNISENKRGYLFYMNNDFLPPMTNLTKELVDNIE